MLGKPIIRGKCVPVNLIIKLVARGWRDKDIIQEYPILKKEDIRTALIYAENGEVSALETILSKLANRILGHFVVASDDKIHIHLLLNKKVG